MTSYQLPQVVVVVKIESIARILVDDEQLGVRHIQLAEVQRASAVSM